MRIKLIKNPVGKYNLAYDPGEEITLPDLQAMELIEDGYAILLQDKKETATSKAIKEKR